MAARAQSIPQTQSILRAVRMTKSWSNRSPSSDVRLRGRKLQQAREELLKRSPCCAKCHRALSLSSMERDHIVNLADGGTDDDSNVQALCIPCHQAKTQSESNRARGLVTKPRMRTGCDVNGYPLNKDHPWSQRK